MRENFFLNFFPNSEKNFKIFFKKFFLAFLESRNHDLRKFAKKNFWNFFPSQTYTKRLSLWSDSYSKKSVFLTFLKRGWLGFAHIRSTCGPDLPRARHALRFDGHFRQGLPRRKVRCAAFIWFECPWCDCSLPSLLEGKTFGIKLRIRYYFMA